MVSQSWWPKDFTSANYQCVDMRIEEQASAMSIPSSQRCIACRYLGEKTPG